MPDLHIWLIDVNTAEREFAATGEFAASGATMRVGVSVHKTKWIAASGGPLGPVEMRAEKTTQLPSLWREMVHFVRQHD